MIKNEEKLNSPLTEEEKEQCQKEYARLGFFASKRFMTRYEGKHV